MSLSLLPSLSFSTDEYRARVAAVQHRIAEAGLDALLCHSFPNICYLTGFETVGAHKYFMLVIRPEGEPSLLTQDFEAHNGRISSWLTDTIVPHSLWDDPIDASRDLLCLLKLEHGRLGVEMDATTLTPDRYRRLCAALPDATLIDASGTVEDVRLIKSPTELGYIRRAAYLSSTGMAAAIDAVVEGGTDNDVARASYDVMIGGGSEYMCYAPIVTVGPRSGIPHSTHRRITLRHGDPVFIEVGACIARYSAPMMRTAVIGPPSDQVRRMADACIASVETMIQQIRPGIAAREVALESRRCVADVVAKGLIWHGYYGYTIGLGFPPEWSDGPGAIAENSDLVLRPGMVFHCSTSLRQAGVCGVAFSETIAVTETGCEVMTQGTRELVVKDT
ncbi:MAG: aminopeptidase P family protein [candidate division Zixibacteria bacterium]|nr:aminopeptidase P family protein [candidate division Zixibacteria bacterium]